jgi:protein gp37
VARTGSFNLPLKRRRTGEYAIPPGETVYTCFTSDFFLEEADPWREEAWRMMAVRTDLSFFIITKRIERLEAHLPPDWGAGYPHVSLGCTVENQDRADYRLPIFLAAPIAHRYIISEPLLESIDLGR